MKENCKRTTLRLKPFQLVSNLVFGFTFFPAYSCRTLRSFKYSHTLATLIIVQSVQLSQNSIRRIEITYKNEEFQIITHLEKSIFLYFKVTDLSARKISYQSPLLLTEMFQHRLINVTYLTACYLYQVMMTLHFLNDVANDAESTQKNTS